MWAGKFPFPAGVEKDIKDALCQICSLDPAAKHYMRDNRGRVLLPSTVLTESLSPYALPDSSAAGSVAIATPSPVSAKPSVAMATVNSTSNLLVELTALSPLLLLVELTPLTLLLMEQWALHLHFDAISVIVLTESA